MNSDQARREQIMNSGAVLPGDPARAAAEETEDFDSRDTGNFDTRTAGRQIADPARREAINQSNDRLPGDLQRARDDHRVDHGGKQQSGQSIIGMLKRLTNALASWPYRRG
jgi:hypothetical protein